jgi:hypothetical protein
VASGTLLICECAHVPPAEPRSLLRGCQRLSRQVQAAVFLCKHSFSGEYLVIALASSAPPILNPSAFSQRRFANSLCYRRYVSLADQIL